MQKVDWDKLKQALELGRSVTLKINDDEIGIYRAANGNKLNWQIYVNGYFKVRWVFNYWNEGENEPIEHKEAKYYPIARRKKHSKKQWESMRKECGKRTANKYFPQNAYSYCRSHVFKSVGGLIRHYKKLGNVYFISAGYSCV